MFLNEEFLNLYEKLSELNESARASYKNGYIESADTIDISKCRMITSDVMDIRGELEQSACLEYKGVLTRVSAQALIFRDGPNGKEVLMRLWRSAVYLPGGGLDVVKDGTNIINTVKREVLEEINFNITNIKPTNSNYWEYSEKPWVEKHVVEPSDRWNGYYTYIFTADYAGEGENDLPEEVGRYRWHKVQDILARPNTKKLVYLKEAIIANGYSDTNETDLEENILTEGKQLGYVSYAIRKSPQNRQHPLKTLETILYSGVIKASKEEDGSNYVSTSRNLLSHLGAGSDWKCGIVLDGDKLTDKYKFTPVNRNSMIYFQSGVSGKQLELKSISKYRARDNNKNFLDKYFYIVNMNGNGFLTLISESTYEILKTIMKCYNAQDAVISGGRAQAKYQGLPNREVKRFYDYQGVEKTPVTGSIGTVMHNERVPAKYAKDKCKWVCVETVGYDVPNSGLVLKLNSLDKYKELVLSQHGIDITSPDFFKQLGGSYADEAEERATAKLLNLVNAYGVVSDESTYGLDISGCIKAILIDDKHRMAFELLPIEDLKKDKIPPLYLYQDEEPTMRADDKSIVPLAISIREFASANNIPIIMFSKYTTNQEILSEIK